MVVVCGKICAKMCGKIEKLLDQNKIWCGTRYGPCDYDSGDKKTKRQKDKKAKRQNDKKTKRTHTWHAIPLKMHEPRSRFKGSLAPGRQLALYH